MVPASKNTKTTIKLKYSVVILGTTIAALMCYNVLTNVPMSSSSPNTNLDNQLKLLQEISERSFSEEPNAKIEELERELVDNKRTIEKLGNEMVSLQGEVMRLSSLMDSKHYLNVVMYVSSLVLGPMFIVVYHLLRVTNISLRDGG